MGSCVNCKDDDGDSRIIKSVPIYPYVPYLTVDCEITNKWNGEIYFS